SRVIAPGELDRPLTMGVLAEPSFAMRVSEPSVAPYTDGFERTKTWSLSTASETGSVRLAIGAGEPPASGTFRATPPPPESGCWIQDALSLSSTRLSGNVCPVAIDVRAPPSGDPRATIPDGVS